MSAAQYHICRSVCQGSGPLKSFDWPRSFATLGPIPGAGFPHKIEKLGEKVDGQDATLAEDWTSASGQNGNPSATPMEQSL